MLKWEKSAANFELSGLMMNGKESSIIVYQRYENNYIFSCPELGIRLKLVEANSSEELKDIVISIVKDRLNSLIMDISNNIDLINMEQTSFSNGIKEHSRDFIMLG